jgi:hypothetical protein
VRAATHAAVAARRERVMGKAVSEWIVVGPF